VGSAFRTPITRPSRGAIGVVSRLGGEEQLSAIKVYKVGDEAEKQAFVVGKTPDGKWAGLKTTVVET
jgi:hypothetical protein